MAIYQDPNDPTPYPEDPYGTPTPNASPSSPTTPTNPTSPADPWDTGPADGNWEPWFMQNVQGLTPSSATLLSLEPKLGKHGIKVLRNAAGIAGKIQLPDGTIVDVGRSFSGSDPAAMAWQWMLGGGAGEGDTTAININPEYTAPWTQEFAAPDQAALQADPSYQWRVGQGRGVLENSAAARGLINSGGTLADLLNYGQQMATQEYGSVYDRRWRKYLEDKDTWYRNQNEAWRKYMDSIGVGSGAAAAS